MSDFNVGKGELPPAPEGFHFGEGFLARATTSCNLANTAPSESDDTYIKVKPLSLTDTIQLLKQNIRREEEFRRGEALPPEGRE